MRNKLPDSWKEVELGEVLDYEQPTDYIVSSEDYSDEYKTPVLTAGKSFILGYTDETNGIYTKLPVIIFDDFTTASHYVTFPFKVKSSAMKFLTPKTKDVNLKYIFWLIQTIKVNSESHKRYYLSKFQYLKIPLPPLPIQQKMVSILERAEKVKEWRNEADELTKEFLKSVFTEMFGNKNKFEIFLLGDITKNLDSKRVPISQEERAKIQGDIPYYGACGIVDGVNDYIFNEEILLIGEDGQNLVSKNKDMAFIVNDKCWVNNHAHVLKMTDKVNIHFLRYFLNRLDYSSMISGSAQPKLTQKNLSEIKIPLPPFPLQQKFASIVKEVEQFKEQQKQSKEHLDNLFNVLTQKAFKGELIL